MTTRLKALLSVFAFVAIVAVGGLYYNQKQLSISADTMGTYSTIAHSHGGSTQAIPTSNYDVFAHAHKVVFSKNIAGTILDSKTRNPIQNIRLTVARNVGQTLEYLGTIQTNVLGQFSINVDSWGQYDLNIMDFERKYSPTSLKLFVTTDGSILNYTGEILLNPVAQQQITVHAKGTPFMNVNANFVVYADGVKIGESKATTVYQDYKYVYNGSPKQIKVYYNNDVYARNLYIDKITVNGKIYSASTAKYMIGTKFDILKLTQPLMAWNGVLIFSL